VETDTLTDSSDKGLIDAHRSGDTDAFGRILRLYGPDVLAYLSRFSGDRNLAEDFFQETFRRVHEKAHTFKGPKLKPWLFTIATRVALNGFRKAKRIPAHVSLNQKFGCDNEGGAELSDVLSKADSPDPAQAAITAEQTQQVRCAVASLPPGQRATLVLAYYQQLTYAQIAEVRNCSVGTVKTQMFRALKSLARKLPDVSGGAK